MTWLQTIALALLQAATEFLPVSSSGHLVLARSLFGWTDEGGLVFDTALHTGSLAAVLAYFWRDWVKVLLSFRAPASAETLFYRRLPWLVALATVPAAAAAPFLKDTLEFGSRSPAPVGLSMLATALLFVLAERRRSRDPAAGHAAWHDAWWIGWAQVVAMLPGASRSGWTVAAGLMRGLDRAGAVRFAFFMAVPAIAGAMAVEAPDLVESVRSGGLDAAKIVIGFGLSLAASLGAIHFCIRFFRTRSLLPFAAYLAAAGALAVGLGLAR